MNYTLELSEAEFDRILQEIDTKMISENVDVRARQILGWMRFCEYQKLEGINFRDPISKKVMTWFDVKYGDRLNIGIEFGHGVCLLRGDLFRFRCPVFFGRMHVFCSPALMGKKKGPLEPNKPALLNVLDQIEGITTAFAHSLSLEERAELLHVFVDTQVSLGRIMQAGTQRFLAEARSDIKDSVEHIMRAVPNFGASKWASLQACEKFLKAYIVDQVIEPDRSHILAKLVTTAEGLGLPLVERTLIDTIQCSPSVRYNSASVSRLEAVTARRNSLILCSSVAAHFNGKSDWDIGRQSHGNLRFDGLPDPVPTVLLVHGKRRST